MTGDIALASIFGSARRWGYTGLWCTRVVFPSITHQGPVSTCMTIRKSMMVAASPRCSILDATHSTVENVVVEIVIETGRSGSLICVIHLLCSNSRFPTSSYYLLGKLNSVSISNSRLPRQYSLQSTEYCIHWSAHEARKLRGSYTK